MSASLTPGLNSSSTKASPSPSKPKTSTNSDWISSFDRSELSNVVKERYCDGCGSCLLSSARLHIKKADHEMDLQL
jgi:hypothetical protein